MKLFKREERGFFGGPCRFFGGAKAAEYIPIPVVTQIKNLFNRMFFNRQG